MALGSGAGPCAARPLGYNGSASQSGHVDRTLRPTLQLGTLWFVVAP